MSCRSNKYLLRLAVPEDSAGILAVLEEIDFEGSISLLYTRRPDAYQSFSLEGEEVVILVCQETISGSIVGVGSCAIRSLFVNGTIEKVGYLTGLRLAKQHRTQFRQLAEAYEFLYDQLKNKGIRYFITTILEDNQYAQKLLEKRRKIMPYYEPFGTYEVYTLKTKKHFHKNLQSQSSTQSQPNLQSQTITQSFRRQTSDCHRAGLDFRNASLADGPNIIEFLHRQGRTTQFFPVVNDSDITHNRFPGLSWEDFYVLTDRAGEILAVGAAWVQNRYKQYIVQGYGGALKYVYPFSWLLPLFGYPALPKIGTQLDFFTLSFWAVKNNDPSLFKTFVENMAVRQSQLPFFLIGVHQNNPLREQLVQMRHIKYASRVYLVNWEKDPELLGGLNDNLVPYLECGTL